MINKQKVSIGWDDTGQIQPCDIVSVQTPNHWLSVLTRRAEQRQFEDKSWASHTGIIASNDYEPIVNEALWKVTERPLIGYKKKSRVCVTRYKFPDFGYWSKAEIKNRIRSRIGAKYDIGKLLLHFLEKPSLIKNVNRPICSYHVAEAFDYVLDKNSFGIPSSETTPDDILDYVLYNFEDSLIWCDSDETLTQLTQIYNDNEYIKELKEKYKLY